MIGNPPLEIGADHINSIKVDPAFDRVMLNGADGTLAA